MATARRLGRFVVLGILVFMLGVMIVGLAARSYVASASGRDWIAGLIARRIGMPVEVQAVSLGVASSSISFTVYDPKLSRSQGEILAIESARANVALWDLALGRLTPSHLDMHKLRCHLRLDREGKLLTTMPNLGSDSSSSNESLPAIVLWEGTLDVQQEGRPDFQLNQLELSVLPQATGEAQIQGRIADPLWADWTVGGAISLSQNTWSLTLSTNDGPLKWDLLTSIPAIPESIWRHVRPNGRGATQITLAQGPDQHFQYLVNIRPAGATLELPDAETTLAEVTGLIRVAGVRLELQGVQAKLAGGTVSVDGGVDFGQSYTKSALKVAASGLKLQALPESWGLPRDIQGELQGHANLEIVVRPDGRIEPRGGGSGTIEHARIRDIPVTIELHLVGNGKNYRFENSAPQPQKPSGSTGQSSRHVQAIRCAARPPQPGAPPPQTKSPPSTLTANVKLRDVEISELLEKLNVQLGYRIQGKVSAEVNLGVSLKRAANQSAYRFVGKLNSASLKLEGLVIQDLSATIVYEEGKLSLTEMEGFIAQPGLPGTGVPGNNKPVNRGRFHGSASLQRDPAGEVKFHLGLDQIPLGEVFQAVPNWSVPIRGLVSGTLDFHTPYLKLSETKAWIATARLTAPELTVAGRNTRGLEVGLEVKEGMARLTNARVVIEGIPVVAEAQVALTGLYRFSATIKTIGTTATDLRKLAREVTLPNIEGLLDTQTDISGTASPWAFDANGKIKATQLTIGKSTANQIALKWKMNLEKLTVTDLTARLFGGTINGSAEIPFDREHGGRFQVEFKTLDAQAATALVADFPVQLSGLVSGSVTGGILPAKPGQSRVGQVDVTLAAPQLTVQGVPTDSLQGKVVMTAGVFDYRLEGKTLGGNFELKGRYPIDQEVKPLEKVKGHGGTFRLTGVDLARIAAAMRWPSLAPLRGRLDVMFNFENDWSRGSGRATLTGLRWGSDPISRELTAVLMLQDRVFRVSELTGRLAGGELWAAAQVRLGDMRRNHFALELRGADAHRLLGPFSDLADKIEGPLTITARGQLGRELRGSGTIIQYGGKFLGVPVANLNLPFDWALIPGGTGRFNIRQGSLNAGIGNLALDLGLRWGYETNVSGEVRFVNLPLRTIVPELASSSLFGNGRITGRFVLSGKAVQSVNDLSGTLIATFLRTSVKEIPILQQTIPFLNAAGLGQPFQSGDIRGVLSNGVFRVERLALVNTSAQVFAHGTITLTGQLKASVVAHTGVIGPANRAFALFGGRLPVIGPLPLTLLQEVSDFLSNRTIRLTLTGNANNPVVRVNAGALLSEEAVRFLLARYVLPASAAEALGLGLERGK